MSSVNKIERAHQMYRDGRYEEALVFYTEALAMSKTKPQKIALHSNRAASYLKLQDFNKAAEECTSVLELDHRHTGALMLRAQTLVTLKEYQSALFDVNRLIDLNPSSEVYLNLQARLKTQLSLAPIPEADVELEEEDEELAEWKEERQDEKEKRDADQKANSESIKEECSSAWQAIPKPKGHSHLDYSRWDRVEDDDDDEEEEEEEECQPHYRFRMRTVGVRPVK